MPKSKPKSTRGATEALTFIDASGGALAALAAGVARALGRTAARAATTSAAVAVPVEIAVVLGEMDATAPEVDLVQAGEAGRDRVDLASWGLVLHQGDGELERLAVARIARDRIARRLESDGFAS
jgi:hypothetical protein